MMGYAQVPAQWCSDSCSNFFINMDIIQRHITSNGNNSNGLHGDGGWENEARLILQEQIDKHNTMGCECYDTKNKRDDHECVAYMWANNKIMSKSIVQDHYHSLSRAKRIMALNNR